MNFQNQNALGCTKLLQCERTDGKMLLGFTLDKFPPPDLDLEFCRLYKSMTTCSDWLQQNVELDATCLPAWQPAHMQCLQGHLSLNILHGTAPSRMPASD